MTLLPIRPLLVSALLTGLSLANGAAPVDCNVTVGMSRAKDGSTLIRIDHAPNCRITVAEGGKTLQIQAAEERTIPGARAPLHTATRPDSNLTERIIALARSKLGDRYQPAQAGPDHFDCSGFVYFLFKSHGIAIPRSSRTQAESGPHLGRDEIRRGDLLFFDTANRGHVNHAGLYLGGGKFIHSSSGHAYGVNISDLDKGFYKERFRWGVRKIPGAKLPEK